MACGPSPAKAQNRSMRCRTPARRLPPAPLTALLGLFSLLAGCASPPSLQTAEQTLPVPVREALQQAGLPASSLAVLVLPADGPTQTPRLALQADRAMQPGSAMKLVTSVVALDHPGLGPTARGFTLLRTRAAQVGEQLQGDLVIQGGADAELGLPQLWALLLELRHQGIRDLQGDIVLDRSLFSPARPELGVPPFDSSPEFAYNVIPDALNLGLSLHGLQLSADAHRVQAQPQPPLPGVQIDNRLTVIDAPCREWDAHGWQPPRTETAADGATRLVLEGGFPRRCTVRPQLQLLERNAQAQAQLRWLWQGLGGQWVGRVRDAQAGDGPAADSRVLARRDARPWGELLRPLNKQSDNAMTRLLYLQLGVAEAQRAAAAATASTSASTSAAPAERRTADWADAAVRRWFAGHGIDSDGLVLDNGSGLSRSERITPRQMAQMLRVAFNGRRAPDLLMSLPVVGEDGTMRRRLTSGPATGLARLKTGTLRNVVALAGLVPDRQGRRWVFVAMINDEAASRGRPALDALVDWVAAADD